MIRVEEAKETLPDTPAQDDEASPVSLSDDERRWLQELPIKLALEKIKKGHWDQRCITCDSYIGNHSVKKMKKCISEQWRKEQDAGLQS